MPDDPQSPMRYASRLTFYASRLNWSLWLGGLIVLLIVIVAIAGPKLAPHDPLEETLIVKVGEKWIAPPFAAFKVPGYPLGSDQFGRDLFSRLLWGVRPTLTMVLIVATVRLILGIVIGLGAGWFAGQAGRILDAIIEGALSVPVLIVALGAIAAVGVEIGVMAFIIGLSINGWVETARVVRERTQLIKGNLYIEAARALGASNLQILFRHILRHIMRMVWMLFAFEIGGTMMATAALGFLGYYIGGDVWVRVTDRAAARLSGMPELGQMLATSWVRIDEPWGMIAVGSVVFVVVLGFNLLGRGLRQRLSLEQRPRQTIVGRTQEAVRAKVTDLLSPLAASAKSVWSPVANALTPTQQEASTSVRIIRSIIALASLLMLAVAALFWWRAGAGGQAEEAELAVQGGQLWAAERRDPQGTLWTHVSLPVAPEVQWVFADPAGFTGGPAVSKEGTVFITSKDGTLYALDPLGNVLWQASLPAAAVGTPGLSVEGNVYATDQEGNLSAFTYKGDLLWRFQAGGEDFVPPTARDFATSGPVVAPDGAIYYVLRGGSVQAVSPHGEALWKTRVLQDPTYSPPRLDATGEWLFLENAIVNARNGDLQELEPSVEVDQYLVGGDGQNYFRFGHTVAQWRPITSAGDPNAVRDIETVHSTSWKDYRAFTAGSLRPSDAGVTHDQLVWLAYISEYGMFGPFEDLRVIWLDMESRVRGNFHHSQWASRVIAVDQENLIYICGLRRRGGVGAECVVAAPGSDEPQWQIPLEKGSKVQGGALVPGRLYVAMDEGFLYAIGEGQPFEIASQEDERVKTPAHLIGPTTSEIAWTFQDLEGFSGDPVVSSEGVVFAASKGGTLYALDSGGNLLWEATLPAAAVGAPALRPTGVIYVADKQGGLSAFAPDGELLWHFQPEDAKPPTVGPLVSSDGTIYYTIGDNVQAVSAEGEALWKTQAQTFRIYTPLRLSPTGEWLFLADDVFDAENGTLLEIETPVEVDQYITGDDGQAYLRAGHTVFQWQPAGSSIEILKSAEWNYAALSGAAASGSPSDAGVTNDQVIWLLYTSQYGDSRIVWLDLTGQVRGTVLHPISQAQIIAVLEGELTTYVCGVREARTNPTPSCLAFAPQSQEPTWQVVLDKGEKIVGGALAPQRLYVATEEGILYTVGEGQVSTQPAPRLSTSDLSAESPPTSKPIMGTVALNETPITVTVSVTHMQPRSVITGDTLTYTLTVTNNGPSVATGVAVTDTLSPGVSLVVATVSQGAGCNHGRDAVICGLGDLANGASAIITVVVTVEPLTSDVITNTAIVASNTIDPDTSDNAVKQQTVVSAGADVAIVQFDVPGPVVAGNTLTYTLTATNNGPADATDVTLTYMMPTSLTRVSVTGCLTKSGDNVSNILTCDLGNLADGANITITVVVTVDASTRGTITNTVSIVANERDPNVANNTVDEGIIVNAEADLTITR